MNRRGFLKIFAVATATIAIAPTVDSFLKAVGPASTPQATVEASVIDFETMSAELKRIYGPHMKDLIFAENPFLAMVSKGDDFAGKRYPVPIHFGDGVG